MYVSLFGWAIGVGLIQGFLHCSGMCGPFVLAFSLSNGHRAGGRVGSFASQLWTGHAPYNLGRVMTFTALGGFFGALGSFVDTAANLHGLQAGAAFLGGGLMLWWAIDELQTKHGGAILERFSLLRLSLTRRLFRHLSSQHRPMTSLLYGSLLGLHPCGLLFAMLFSAAATGSPVAGALILLAFGLGTVPSLLTVAVMGWYGRKRLQGVVFTYAAASLIGCSGILFILRGMVTNGWIHKVNPWLF